MASIRPFALSAAILGILTTVLYVAVMVDEGNNTIGEMVPWAGVMVVGSVCAAVGAMSANRVAARITLLVTIVLFAAVGMLAIFSFGLLLLVACGLSVVALVRVAPAGPDGAP